MSLRDLTRCLLMAQKVQPSVTKINHLRLIPDPHGGKELIPESCPRIFKII